MKQNRDKKIKPILGTLALLGMVLVEWKVNAMVKDTSLVVLDACASLIYALVFFGIVAGSLKEAIAELKTRWTNIMMNKKGVFVALAFMLVLLVIIVSVIGVSATEILLTDYKVTVPNTIRLVLYGVANFLAIIAFIKVADPVSSVISVAFYALFVAGSDIVMGMKIVSATLNLFWYLIIGYGILSKNEGFAFTFALLFNAIFSCNLLCACEKYNIAGFTFVTEPATGFNETMGLLFGLLLLSMAYLAHYFYEYAYAYSLPMKEVVQKTKFAYQRTWGGKPLVIAELLPLLKKNRENIKIWSDAVITHEDYARSRTMSCNESYYGVHGFQNGAWHRFDDGLLVHAETTSNREGRFRLNYHWPADRFLIKVIEKDKLYVGIFAVVATLEEVQSYGKAYNFHAPPNVLSRWTKAPLNFRCQCALLYDVSTGEEAYIRYDVIDHPEGFRRNLRGFSGGITLD